VADAGALDAGAPVEPTAVLTRVCGPEDCEHHLNAFAELPLDGVIDRSRGVELGDVEGKVFGDAIFVFDAEASIVTRWTVGDDLEPRRGATMSFGMPAVFRWPQVIGGRAYFAASWTKLRHATVLGQRGGRHF
jgi:hypothetical protein